MQQIDIAKKTKKGKTIEENNKNVTTKAHLTVQ